MTTRNDGRSFVLPPYFPGLPQTEQQARGEGDASRQPEERTGIREQRRLDALTGTANRSSLLREIGSALGNSKKSQENILILYLDLNDFRQVNDTFGFQTGDRLLVEVSRRLESLLQKKDVLGRIYGNEFVILLQDVLVNDGSIPRAESIARSFDTPFMVGDLEIHVSASIGGVMVSNRSITPAEILQQAETAMTMVKNGDHVGVFIADRAMLDDLKFRSQLDSMILEGMRNNMFFLLYQPIIDLKTSKCIGAEALLRLKREDGTVYPASEFMTAVTRTRHLELLDKWVLRESIHAIRTSGKNLVATADFRVSLNLSPAILSTSGYAEHCKLLLRGAGIPTASLGIEIKGSHFLFNNHILQSNLNTLHSSGMEIGIDHFGNKNINLRELSLLPITTVKIDASFLGGALPHHSRENMLLRSLLAIAKNLGFRVIAVGIEDPGVAQQLEALGCDAAQGNLYASPMPMKELPGSTMSSGEKNP